MTPRSNYRLPRIPEMTIRRLSVYTRCLLQLEEDGVKTVSSQELADRFNLNSAQVRKDLAYFGEFGVRGIGYYVSGLKAELQKILGLDREWTVVLVGFGNLGSALSRYKGFARQGFRIVAVVDDDPAKVGREIDHMPVIASRDMAREIKARGAQIAIVAVPAESAQTVTDQLVAAGIKAILNFAPARLAVPRGVGDRRPSLDPGSQILRRARGRVPGARALALAGRAAAGGRRRARRHLPAPRRRRACGGRRDPRGARRRNRRAFGLRGAHTAARAGRLPGPRAPARGARARRLRARRHGGRGRSVEPPRRYRRCVLAEPREPRAARVLRRRDRVDPALRPDLPAFQHARRRAPRPAPRDAERWLGPGATHRLRARRGVDRRRRPAGARRDPRGRAGEPAPP